MVYPGYCPAATPRSRIAGETKDGGPHAAPARAGDRGAPVFSGRWGTEVAWTIRTLANSHHPALTRSAAVSGAAAGPLLDRTLQPGIGLGGRVWQSGRPVTVDDYHADPRIVHTEAVDRLVRRVGIAAGVGVPITLGEERLGVIVVGD